MTRFLGIDYGEKKIGLAISDEEGKLAFPFKILKNNLEIIDTIHNICGEQNIEKIVIGESTDLFGKKNKIMNKIERFKKEIEKIGLPTFWQKEFLTSFEARVRIGKEKNISRKKKILSKKQIDDSAAALILQRYLDKKQNNQLPD